MADALERTRLLIGAAGIERLRRARVAVFGLGGVGGYAVEALARSGVGALDLIDNDRISLSNLNRQLLATRATLGQYKTDAARRRISEIDPEITVRVYRTFFLPETAAQFDFSQYDYIADAIDTVAGKIELAVRASAAGIPIISCMGAGNKLDASAFTVADLAKTSVCPLARVMRKELGKRGIRHLKVVYSRENPLSPARAGEAPPEGARSIPGSVSFVPGAAGLLLAGEIILDIAGARREDKA